ncbi:MAG: hypothetical protein ACYST9_01185 [Planctomycetota bacterium]|jgi:hypothetical protein
MSFVYSKNVHQKSGTALKRSIKKTLQHILVELKDHAPFTIFGAVMGAVFMLIFRNFGDLTGHRLFTIFHPLHVVLSAMVTASMLKIHYVKRNLLRIIIIGYLGSVGIATASDIVIPHIGSCLLGLDVPSHAQTHHRHDLEHNDNEHCEKKIYLGFIEEWYIVNPAAFLGIAIAMFLPRTKFPHAGHVLVSTWASASYLMMSVESQMSIAGAIIIFVTLFIAVWLPCCISDIVFPLLFVRSDDLDLDSEK